MTWVPTDDVLWHSQKAMSHRVPSYYWALRIWKSYYWNYCHILQGPMGLVRSGMFAVFIVPRSGTYEIAWRSSRCMWVFFHFCYFLPFGLLSLIFKVIKHIPFNILDILLFQKINSTSFLLILAKFDLFYMPISGLVSESTELTGVNLQQLAGPTH